MCGIAGFFNRESNSWLLRSMISQLRHRGPDGFGYYTNHQDRVSLAHARLSIIDLEGGFQPIRNEDKTIWVVFNGEIFNYIELRETLKSFGHKFYTDTDTEVIVHAYEEFGEAFPSVLNGQFSIALWDENKKQGMLVRDKVGIQPMFYGYCNKSLFFGSEVKSLLIHPCLKQGLNKEQLANVFTFWTTSPGETVFNGIKELQPGHMAIFKNKQLVVKQWWDHQYAQETFNNDDEAAKALELHLSHSVDIRLRSDVPVGAYLSGGIDSTVIAALVKKNFEGDLRTFSIKFRDAKFDESSYQQDAIDHLGVNHTSFTCSENDIANSFEQVIFHTEKPILRTAPVPMYLLSKLVKEQGYKVVLTGEGADEVFGGYDIFREDYVRRAILANPDDPNITNMLLDLYPWMGDRISKSTDYLKSFFTDFADVDANWFSHEPRWRTTGKSHKFFSNYMPTPEMWKFGELFGKQLDEITDPLQRAQYLEFHTLFNGYLISSQGDRMLMANGVEGRFPFLDPNVVSFGDMLAPQYKLKDGINEKHILKEMARSLIPLSIFNRKKQPYMAPDGASFFPKIGQQRYVDDMLSNETLLKYGYFEPRKVEILKKKFQSGRGIGFSDNMSLVGILSTQILHSTFVENFHIQSTASEDEFVIKVERGIEK